MNSPLNLAYDHGVQRALQEAGITKVALSPELLQRAYQEAERRSIAAEQAVLKVLPGAAAMPEGAGRQAALKEIHALQSAQSRRHGQAASFKERLTGQPVASGQRSVGVSPTGEVVRVHKADTPVNRRYRSPGSSWDYHSGRVKATEAAAGITKGTPKPSAAKRLLKALKTPKGALAAGGLGLAGLLGYAATRDED